jgi:transposase
MTPAPLAPLAPLGIDIAKRSFDAVVLLPTGKPHHKHFANSPAGFQALLAWLQKRSVTQVHACREATGTYGEALATFLHDQGHRVSVVNPKRIAHYAKSRLSRAKTDKGDAHLIAAFCQQEQPTAWTPSDPMYRTLRALLRHREARVQTRQRERNRLGSGCHPAAVRTSLQAFLTYLETALEKVEQAIRAHLAAHPELQAQRKLLLSIPGIGEATAHWLLAELGGAHGFRSARQAAAFVGLDPRLLQSGVWQGQTRLSKQGNALLRAALYFPALTALRFNPVLQAFAARLRERGKGKMVIVGAVMRKLVHLAFGVLHNDKAFDPAWTQA